MVVTSMCRTRRRHIVQRKSQNLAVEIPALVASPPSAPDRAIAQPNPTTRVLTIFCIRLATSEFESVLEWIRTGRSNFRVASPA